MTKSLIKSCRKKNKLYKNYINYKIPVNEITYKRYRNRLTSILRYCEKKYYSDLLVKYSNNIKKTWSVLNDIIKKKRC